MTKIEVELPSEYGIMFLYDSKKKPIFPVGAGKDPVMWTSTCLAFNVLTYVDGDAKVILCDVPHEETGDEYFAGEIECPNRSLSLYDHSGFAFASIPLRDGFAKVSLRMSEEKNPRIVQCAIENLVSF